MLSLQSIRRAHANNIATFLRDPVAEISGSLGDLGTLLPLMIALAANYSISLSSTLVFSGIWNILTGVIFGIPLPVQPMKVRGPCYFSIPHPHLFHPRCHKQKTHLHIYQYMPQQPLSPSPSIIPPSLHPNLSKITNTPPSRQ